MITPEQLASDSESDKMFEIIQHKIISRKEALEKGLTYYFTGVPCNKGHIDLIYVSAFQCRTCKRNSSNAYYRKSVDKVSNKLNFKIYGVTNQDIEAMRIAQDNKCFICENKFKNSRDMHMDHCHKTNILRKLLCHKCNTGLGLFNDDIKLLEKAIKYLNDNSP